MRVGVEVDEHQPPPHAHGHGQEAELVDGEVGIAEVPRPLQAPVELVGPTVVPADERAAVARARVDEWAGAMAAHVVERAQLAVVARDHEQAPTAEVRGQVVAGRLELARPSDHQPLAPEEPGALPLVDLGVVVPGAGQGASRAHCGGWNAWGSSETYARPAIVTRGTAMQLGMIGLGRMGANLVRRLMQRRPRVRRLRRQRRARWSDLERRRRDRRGVARRLRGEAHRAACGVDHGARRLRGARPWTTCAERLEPGDIIIDGGNSYYRDDIDRAAALKRAGHPLRRRRHQRRRLRARAGVLPDDRRRGRDRGAPRPDLRHHRARRRRRPRAHRAATGEPSPAEQGYLHCGPHGAGHFVKMVHNGIEYGLMAAYAEGLGILRRADLGKAEQTHDAETAPLTHAEYYQYEIDTAEVAEVWRRGSVVGSWLLDLTAAALLKDPGASASAVGCRTPARVAGPCRPRSTSACPRACSPPPCSSASARRAPSDFADKVLSAMRKEFGGHDERAPAGSAAPDLAAASDERSAVADHRGGRAAGDVRARGRDARHRRSRFGDEELLDLSGGIARYEQGHQTGLPLLAPWANRLGGRRYEVDGVVVDLDGLELGTDPNGLPIHGTMTAARGWEVVASSASRSLRARFDYGARPDLLRRVPLPPRPAWSTSRSTPTSLRVSRPPCVPTGDRRGARLASAGTRTCACRARPGASGGWCCRPREHLELDDREPAHRRVAARGGRGGARRRPHLRRPLRPGRRPRSLADRRRRPPGRGRATTRATPSPRCSRHRRPELRVPRADDRAHQRARHRAPAPLVDRRARASPPASRSTVS